MPNIKVRVEVRKLPKIYRNKKTGKVHALIDKRKVALPTKPEHMTDSQYIKWISSLLAHIVLKRRRRAPTKRAPRKDKKTPPAPPPEQPPYVSPPPEQLPTRIVQTDTHSAVEGIRRDKEMLAKEVAELKRRIEAPPAQPLPAAAGPAALLPAGSARDPREVEADVEAAREQLLEIIEAQNQRIEQERKEDRKDKERYREAYANAQIYIDTQRRKMAENMARKNIKARWTKPLPKGEKKGVDRRQLMAEEIDKERSLLGEKKTKWVKQSLNDLFEKYMQTSAYEVEFEMETQKMEEELGDLVLPPLPPRVEEPNDDAELSEYEEETPTPAPQPPHTPAPLFDEYKLEEPAQREFKRRLFDDDGDGQEAAGASRGGLKTSDLDEMMSDWPGYLGTIPRNHVEGLAKVHPDETGGFIMNLDPAGKPGSHWVAIYFDAVKDKSIEYYDPFGVPIPEDIRKRTITWLSNKLDSPVYLKLKENLVKNQSVTNQNCGWHCMNFLYQRSNDVPFAEATGFALKKKSDVEKHEKQVRGLKKKFGYI